MGNKVYSAVIPVAGVGSRMLPATWSIDKCMLPIYAGKHTRLLVDWMVDECSRAGIKRIVFITTERGKKQLFEYFEKMDSSIQQRYIDLGKSKFIEKERERRAAYGLQYDYIIQGPGPYGTAVPPSLARDVLRGEKRWCLVGGDDFVYHQDSAVSDLALAIAAWNEAGTDNVILGHTVDRQDAPRYGVLLTDKDKNMIDMLEKPSIDKIPDYPKIDTNISRFGFTDAFWDFLQQEIETDRDGEHYITYAILNAIKANQSFRVSPITGKYLEGGSADDLMAAGQYISSHPPL